MGMLRVNNGGGGGCGCPSLAGLGLDSTIPVDNSGVTWDDYSALLDAYQAQGLTLTQAQAAAGKKVTAPAATAGQLIAGISNTYLIMGAAAVLMLVMVSSGR